MYKTCSSLYTFCGDKIGATPGRERLAQDKGMKSHVTPGNVINLDLEKLKYTRGSVVLCEDVVYEERDG